MASLKSVLTVIGFALELMIQSVNCEHQCLTGQPVIYELKPKKFSSWLLCSVSDRWPKLWSRVVDDLFIDTKLWYVSKRSSAQIVYIKRAELMTLMATNKPIDGLLADIFVNTGLRFDQSFK